MAVLLQLILLTVFVSICVPDKLDELRRSCKYHKILIESSRSKQVPIYWILPKEKELVFKEECENAVHNVYSRNRTRENEKEMIIDECHKSPRVRRALIKTLPSKPIFKGFSRSNGIESSLSDTTQFKCALRDLLRNLKAHQIILDELITVVEKTTKEHLEPHIRLNSTVHSAKCMDNRVVMITVEVMQPDELLIWRCEDVGKVENNTYEFYNLSPAWMAVDGNGRTFKINMNQCLENKNNETFCPLGSKAYYNAVCSINNINACEKTFVWPSKEIGSFSRTLPDGIAVYGTFKKMLKMSENANITTSPRSDRKLYYFSFRSTKLPEFRSKKSNRLF